MLMQIMLIWMSKVMIEGGEYYSTDGTSIGSAPHEADAQWQLAYLSTLKSKEGGIAAVISEDSDLLAYSCPAIIFKDRFGNGEEIILDKVLNSVGRVPSFQKFDKSLFTGMCVLAGCDFLPSIPRIGISKAYNLVSKYQNLDHTKF